MQEFDYVVVGAGSAGCVVAARLSETGRHSVALVEAGGNDSHFWVDVPLGFGKLYNSRKLNWSYESEPEPGLKGARSYQPRGKLVGGTGAINGTVYMRGRREDYEHWRSLGNDGWGYEDVLPFFRKSERNQRGASRHHGGGGEISVVDVPRHELGDALLAAARERGQPINSDHSGPSHEGFGYTQMTTHRGKRSSSASAILRPALKRRNLRLISHALVTRILVNDGVATGVELRRNGTVETLKARREVIVSGGTFNSPQLLQVSGIGPAALLGGLGIPLVRDLPGVGENLQDHFGASIVYRCTRPVTIPAVVSNPARLAWMGLEYLLFRKGLMATNGTMCIGYVRSDPARQAADAAIALVGWARAANGLSSSGLGLQKFSSFTLTTSILHPESRGSVRIKSSDPMAAPEIRFNFFQSAADHATMVGAIRVARQIMASPPMAPYVAEEIMPGPGFQADHELIDYCRDHGRSTHHAAGTCKMGIDDMAVVDPRLRVRGVGRLRVVDASVMPSMVAGNINAPTVMIAEKGAAMILEDAS